MQTQRLRVNFTIFLKLTIASCLMTLILSSCGPDGLTESINPITGSDPVYHVLELSESSNVGDISFEMKGLAKIQQPDCPDEPISLNVNHNELNIPQYEGGCYGTYTLSELGQGWMEEFGRYVSSITIDVDPSKNHVISSIELKFPGDATFLVIGGSNAFEIVEIEGVLTIVADVSYVDGSGPFANIDFNGKLYIMNADQIFKCKGADCCIPIKIVGVFEY